VFEGVLNLAAVKYHLYFGNSFVLALVLVDGAYKFASAKK